MKKISHGFKRIHLIVLLLLSPYLVGFSPVRPDSSSTHIGFAGGTASYADVSRDCSGRVISVTDVPFSEAAVSVDHYTPVLHLDLRAGSMPAAAAKELFDVHQNWSYDQETPITPLGRVFYGIPMIGLNTTHFGLDVGLVVPAQQKGYHISASLPAGSLRFGRSDRFHFRIRLANDLPLMTGGPGVLNWGFGFNLGKPRHSMWVGMGGMPYDAMVFGTQVEFPLSDAVFIQLGGAVGGGKTAEYGLSARTRIVF